MSNIFIDYFYGVYPSSVFGDLALLDPLLPPRKCILDCSTCPLHYTTSQITTKLESPTIPIEGVLNSINKYIEDQTSLFNGVLIWGYGDPILSRNIFEFILASRVHINKHKLGNKIYVHTNLVSAVKSCTEILTGYVETPECTIYKSLIEQIDGFIIPFILYTTERHIFGWPIDISITNYLTTLRELFKTNMNKLFLEIYLFRLEDSLYPERNHIEELTVLLKHLHAKNILLKLIDRPLGKHKLKPVPASYADKIQGYLENEGLKVQVEYFRPLKQFSFNYLINVIYNQLLRIPLKHSEIRALYGDKGTIALNNLVSKNYATKITWISDVYYLGKIP
ncbi:MAG: hypothetical protein QXE81_02060 [Desulfurococcaceae archaeon]